MLVSDLRRNSLDDACDLSKPSLRWGKMLQGAQTNRLLVRNVGIKGHCWQDEELPLLNIQWIECPLDLMMEQRKHIYIGLALSQRTGFIGTCVPCCGRLYIEAYGRQFALMPALQIGR